MLFSFNCFSSDALDSTLKAVGKTNKGKELNKKINKKLKIVPEELLVFSSFAITQDIIFNMDNQNFRINTKDKSITYKIQYSF